VGRGGCAVHQRARHKDRYQREKRGETDAP